jgi:hypothetical protein
MIIVPPSHKRLVGACSSVERHYCRHRAEDHQRKPGKHHQNAPLVKSG